VIGCSTRLLLVVHQAQRHVLNKDFLNTPRKKMYYIVFIQLFLCDSYCYAIRDVSGVILIKQIVVTLLCLISKYNKNEGFN
jgi:hypothetical protein